MLTMQAFSVSDFFHIMGGTRLKFETWKVRIHTQNASQSHFYCFVKEILKSGFSLKSLTHVIFIKNLII